MSEESQRGEQSEQPKPGQKKPNASDDDAHPANSDQPVAGAKSVLPPSPSDSKKANQPTHTRRENVKYGFELVGIAGGLVGILFLVLQYNEMVKATKATLASVEVSQKQLHDSESQQGAVLDMETIRVNRVTNDSILGIVPGHYTVQFSIVLVNHGETRALDVREMEKTYPAFTNSMRKYNRMTNEIGRDSINPFPQAGVGGPSITSQMRFTNTYEMGYWTNGGEFQIKSWVRYRDIFGNERNVSGGGRYEFTNNTFTTNFFNGADYSGTNQAEFDKVMNAKPK